MELQKHQTMEEKRFAAREILENARFEEDQAEAIIATVNLATENLATKDDVEELRSEMQQGFKLLDDRMNLLDERLNLSDERTDNKIEKIYNKFEQMDNKLDANANNTNARFDRIESKFENLTHRLILTSASTIIVLAALYAALTKFLG